MRRHIGMLMVMGGGAALVAALCVAATGFIELPTDMPMSQPITCLNNLKQIGLSFKTWALDHGDQFPFNLSTNQGGTLEYCVRGTDGFDKSAAIHFQVMSNDLTTPLILVCPRDRKAKRAAAFSSLRAENVSYQMRSGTNVTDTHPEEVLLQCPIHGNILHCDGSVTEIIPEPKPRFPSINDLLTYNAQFRARVTESAAVAILGCVLMLVGIRVRPRRAEKVPLS